MRPETPAPTTAIRSGRPEGTRGAIDVMSVTVEPSDSVLSNLCLIICRMFVKGAATVYGGVHEGFGTAYDADW